MTRSINANALAKLGTNYGTEPISIVAIQWAREGSYTLYSDRDIGTSVKGKILQLSQLDNTVTANGGGDSQQISLVLDDTDGELKNIFNYNDIHKVNVIVYQWFEGLSLADAFVVFTGQINSPVAWDEGTRQLSFEVINQLEDLEVGFSAEEGQFPEIPDEMIGEPWPMLFGTVLDSPALNINKTITGTTQQGVGIVSGKDLHAGIFTENPGNAASVGVQIAQLSAQISHANIMAQAWRSVSDEDNNADAYLSQANSLRAQLAQIANSYELNRTAAIAQRAAEVQQMNDSSLVGPSSIKVLGGEDFPQGIPVTVDIGGGLFTGVFNCQTFNITSRTHPENELKAQAEYDRAIGNTSGVSGISGQNFFGGGNAPQGGYYRYVDDDPRGAQGTGFAINPKNGKRLVITEGFIVSTDDPGNKVQVEQVAQHFWAEAGSQVKLVTDQTQYYIVSMVPGTVKAVKAYKTFNGVKTLVNVPTSLWSQVNRTYGPITAVTVELTKQLSQIPDQNWSDDIYVTFESSVGPNAVTIMEYLLASWSNLTTDSTSFNSVKTSVANFPMNFGLYERENVISLVSEIARQARCAFFAKGGVAYLNFLAAEPSSSTTFTESDIVPQTMRVSFTPTEEIITKMDIKFRVSYAEDGERRMILRHNVAKYGVQETSEDWFCYTNPDVIRHCATFWLIRRANTWKRVEFEGFLNKLAVETFDCVTLDFNQTYVAEADTKAIVEQASYDSQRKTIQFQFMTPVKSGTMTSYPFFWPSAQNGTFPAPGDYGGGGGIGVNASGVLPIGNVSVANKCVDGQGIFIGGPNIVFAGPADQGTPNLNDSEFTVQPLIFPTTDFTVEPGENPRPNLRLSYEPELPLFQPIQQPTIGNIIDINTTTVVDSSQSGLPTTTLKDVFREINSDEELVLDTEAKFSDGSNEEAFDFRYDDEGQKFGAGTAFLKED